MNCTFNCHYDEQILKKFWENVSTRTLEHKMG